MLFFGLGAGGGPSIQFRRLCSMVAQAADPAPVDAQQAVEIGS